MFEDDEIRLRHALDAAREVVDFTKGHRRVDMDTDDLPPLIEKLEKILSK